MKTNGAPLGEKARDALIAYREALIEERKAISGEIRSVNESLSRLRRTRRLGLVESVREILEERPMTGRELRDAAAARGHTDSAKSPLLVLVRNACVACRDIERVPGSRPHRYRLKKEHAQ